MKLTTFLLLISFTTFASTGYSQAEKVSIQLKDATIKDLFRVVENQTSYKFLYRDDAVENIKVTMDELDTPLDKILNEVLAGSGFSYKILTNNLIVIGSKELLQQIKIAGTVTDEKGNPLPGVTVLVKGSTIGAVTDASGKYIMNNAPQVATLIFSFVGMEKQEIAANGRVLIDVVLHEAAINLNEVVVVGYGTQNKRTVTGSVSSVSEEDLKQVNATSLDNILQGKAAGLNISSYTAQPGGAVSVNIRGAISPYGDNSPLYVIDGMPITNNSSTEYNSSANSFRGGFNRSPLDNINPNDIESVDVLKDASATAIYGSAAANGVILITTKRGKEGGITVDYNGTYSIQDMKKYLTPLNATQFENAVNNLSLEYAKFNQRVAPYGTNTLSYTPYFTQTQVDAAGQGIDYLDYVLRHGVIIDQNISITGGTDRSKIYCSFNYFNQNGLIKQSDLKRYIGRLNFDQKIGKLITFSLGLTYSQINSNNQPTGQSTDTDSPSLLQDALQFAPTIPLYDANGNISKTYYQRIPSPLSFMMITNQNFSHRLLFTPKLSINIIDGLKLYVTAGIDNTGTDRQFYVPLAAGFATVPEGDAQRGYTKLNNYSLESYASYNKIFGINEITAVIGVGAYESNYNDFGLDAQGFGTDVFGVNNIGIASDKLLSSMYSTKTARTKLSQFTRLNYTLLKRYILQITGRFDGSSNFPSINKYGFFPGVSIGWLLKDESFLKNVKALSQLKLRAGYGTSGNESITINGNYALTLYSASNQYNYLIGNTFYNSGFLQSQLGNPNLKWETDITFNAGLDFGFLNNRLTGSFDYFRRKASDLLDFQTLPASNAINNIAANVGSTRSTGFEVALQSENIKSGKFSWTTSLTFSTFKAYWVTRNPQVSFPSYVGIHDQIHAVYGWKTDGLIRSAADIPIYQSKAFVGNIKYVDFNGDGKLDEKDVVNLGSTDPKATFGMNNKFKFGNIDLNIYLYGALGNITWDAYQQFASGAGKIVRPGAPGNADVHALDIYTAGNTDATYPGFASDLAASNNPTGTNDFQAIKNSFFTRVKSIDLGYSLHDLLMGKQKLFRSARVFIDLSNLFYLTNIRGFDPEMERNNNPYPTALTTAFGISAEF